MIGSIISLIILGLMDVEIGGIKLLIVFLIFFVEFNEFVIL